MGALTVGDVVLVLFPYADFSQFKKRPALLVGSAEFDNVILCQITSKAHASKQAISLLESDFRIGRLSRESYIRPDKIFTLEKSLIESKIGSLSKEKVEEVRKRVSHIFSE